MISVPHIFVILCLSFVNIFTVCRFCASPTPIRPICAHTRTVPRPWSPFGPATGPTVHSFPVSVNLHCSLYLFVEWSPLAMPSFPLPWPVHATAAIRSGIGPACRSPDWRSPQNCEGNGWTGWPIKMRKLIRTWWEGNSRAMKGGEACWRLGLG